MRKRHKKNLRYRVRKKTRRFILDPNDPFEAEEEEYELENWMVATGDNS